MQSAIEPCMERAAREMAGTGEHEMHQQIAMRDIYACLKETDDYLVSNADGHYFKVLFPVFIVALANIPIFGFLFYVRAVRNFRFGDPRREQAKAASLPMQQDDMDFESP